MKETVKVLARHNRLLAKCLAILEYITKGKNYQDAQRAVEIFVRGEKKSDRRYIRNLIGDMLFSRFYYWTSMDEYFFYRFMDKTDAERRAYIGWFEKKKLCDDIGDTASRKPLDDKYECYVIFREYYGRDMMKISGPEDKSVFEEFLSKHREFMVKPIDRSGGRGIYRMVTESADIDKCFQMVLADGPCIVEQCIHQASETAQFHPQSVNSIRIATFNNAGSVKILFSMFRAGIGDSIIDNVTAGGIYALVNTETGKIQSDGYIENGGIYQKAHPDTGCIFNGFQLPCWSNLLHIVLEAAQSFPQHHYISWDFALTDSGWVMIEANSRGEFDWYQTLAGGFREVFMKEYREYKNRSSV